MSRRSVVVTLAAAFAAAFGTAAVLPRVAETASVAIVPTAAMSKLPPPPVTESETLLALGAELDDKNEAYRAAAAQLQEARATAKGM
ncbi:hypothetical protein [Bradyrhizobium sp. CIR48]|uniref:hypothetical protein n=1 Tax=Bradyrhizobium sp. CIR48 TaxID=2663840 RepID=UPI001AEE9798|nr:hypothetical protein [Bradyrhizobium sp. CIR48]